MTVSLSHPLHAFPFSPLHLHPLPPGVPSIPSMCQTSYQLRSYAHRSQVTRELASRSHWHRRGSAGAQVEGRGGCPKSSHPNQVWNEEFAVITSSYPFPLHHGPFSPQPNAVGCAPHTPSKPTRDLGFSVLMGASAASDTALYLLLLPILCLCLSPSVTPTPTGYLDPSSQTGFLMSCVTLRHVSKPS